MVSLLIDREKKLWIGTYFGGLDCFDGKTFTHYRHNNADTGSLSDDRVMCLYEDSEADIWVGTLAGGMDRLDRRKKSFYHFNTSRPNSVQNNYISSIIEDVKKNLWVATGYGIDVLDSNKSGVRHYSVERNQLSSDNVTLIFRDSRENIWAATREGLSLFDPKKDSFQSFTTEEGLPDNTIRSIQEDRSRHELWISTTNGLCRIRMSATRSGRGFTIKCRNFHEQDGLQGREFNERAGLVTSDGLILFSGPNGFNIFPPTDISSSETTPPIVLTDLQIFNRSVKPGDTSDGHVILKKALSETTEIILNHHDNMFSVEFASLGFVQNVRNKYAYTLEGFNTSWLTTDGKNRKATYTNLDAGDYLFKVRASNEDGGWYDQERTLHIILLPPFWKTRAAYFIYCVLLAGGLFVGRRVIIKRAKARFSLEQERSETRRMHEMDLMKIRFFTNMSHELRTPLSLILAPMEKLLHQPNPPEQKKQYDMIQRNAKRLLHLVNQLLDFRKMEVNELKLHPQQGDVIRFVKDVCHSFTDLAEKRTSIFPTGKIASA